MQTSNTENTTMALSAGPPDDGQEPLYFIRLNRSEKIQHLLLMISFVVLVITGFMLKLPETIVQKIGPVGETLFFYRSLLHRIAGTVMIAVSAYHLFYLALYEAGRRWLVDMLPQFKDLKDLIQNLMYYVKLRDRHPEFDRFSYMHKMEYWALVAGTTLMSLSGLLLWTEWRWSKFVLDVAAVVHGMEAVLACLAIMVWHMYEIHLKPHKSPMDKVWLTGCIDEAEMKEEHPLHYQKIMADSALQHIYIVRPPR